MKRRTVDYASIIARGGLSDDDKDVLFALAEVAVRGGRVDRRGRPIARMTAAELCVAATRVAVRRKICTVACGQRRPGGWSVDAAAFAQAMQDPDVIAYAASLVGEAPADPDQRVPIHEDRLRAILVDLMEAKGEPEAAQEYALEHARNLREARDPREPAP